MRRRFESCGCVDRRRIRAAASWAHRGEMPPGEFSDKQDESNGSPHMPDVVVIGAGVNGLVAATFLAKAGLKPLVLERSDRIGGCAVSAEIATGFRGPTLAHSAAIDPAVMRSLALDRHGLQILRPDAHVFAPTLDGRALVLWADQTRAARDVAAFS